MTYRTLDAIVLTRDLPAYGLRSGDLGAVVMVHDQGALDVEFVTASGRTEALITVNSGDVRPATDDDVIAVRRPRRS